MNNKNNMNQQSTNASRNENRQNNADSKQGQGMNNNGRRYNSPMEQARRNRQGGFNQNPYINQNNVSGMNSQNMGQNPYYNNQNIGQIPANQTSKSVTDSLLGSFDTANFLKGALIGAVGAYLLTNEKAQKTIFKGVVKATDMFQAGMEEMKERFEDAKAELEAEE